MISIFKALTLIAVVGFASAKRNHRDNDYMTVSTKESCIVRCISGLETSFCKDNVALCK